MTGKHMVTTELVTYNWLLVLVISPAIYCFNGQGRALTKEVWCCDVFGGCLVVCSNPLMPYKSYSMGITCGLEQHLVMVAV